MEESVSVHIVTFNSARYIRPCLDAVSEQSRPPEEIVVIDNASTDDSVSLVEKAPPAARLIRNDRNIGYSAAHNQAIKMTNTRFVLLLNPDVVLTRDFLERMLEAAAVHERIGAVSGKLIRLPGAHHASPEKTRIIDSAGIYMTPNQRHLDRGSGEEDRGQYDTMAYVFGASGAAPLFRREALDDLRIGEEYFDEDFFCYREDADLAWRAQLFGWRTLYTPRAVAYHARRVLPENRRELPPELNMHSVKNRFLLRLKNQTPAAALPFLVPMLFRDLQLLVYVLLFERSSIPGLVYVLRHFRGILRKRSAIMSRRTAANRDIIRWFRRRARPLDE
jgi:GT2 family glycosyltransferase